MSWSTKHFINFDRECFTEQMLDDKRGGVLNLVLKEQSWQDRIREGRFVIISILKALKRWSSF